MLKSCICLLVVSAASVQQLQTEFQAEVKGEVLVVRTMDPTPATLKRMSNFAEDLELNMPHVQMVLSVDTSKVDRVAELKQALPSVLVHSYTWSEVTGRYPHLLTIEGPQHPPWFHVSAWNFKMEPSFLTMEFTKKKANISSSAPVWIFEDDVFVCGNLSEFLSGYERSNADLLTAMYEPITQFMQPFWNPEIMWQHRDEATPEFLQEHPVLDERYFSYEQVQKFSANFFAHLEERSRVNRVTSQSEMFSTTECMKFKRFTCKTFLEKDVGVYGFEYHVKYQRGVDLLCLTQRRGTINHAAKFIADVPLEA